MRYQNIPEVCETHTHTSPVRAVYALTHISGAPASPHPGRARHVYDCLAYLCVFDCLLRVCMSVCMCTQIKMIVILGELGARITAFAECLCVCHRSR